MWSWSQANRPIVVAYVETVASGNVATVLQLVVENVGNRPAACVQLIASPDELSQVRRASAGDAVVLDVERCFSPRAVIPVLKPGQKVTNAFGQLTADSSSTWVPESRLAIQLSYSGYERERTYSGTCQLLLSNDHGFAGSSWREA